MFFFKIKANECYRLVYHDSLPWLVFFPEMKMNFLLHENEHIWGWHDDFSVNERCKPIFTPCNQNKMKILPLNGLNPLNLGVQKNKSKELK